MILGTYLRLLGVGSCAFRPLGRFYFFLVPLPIRSSPLEKRHAFFDNVFRPTFAAVYLTSSGSICNDPAWPAVQRAFLGIVTLATRTSLNFFEWGPPETRVFGVPFSSLFFIPIRLTDFFLELLSARQPSVGRCTTHFPARSPLPRFFFDGRSAFPCVSTHPVGVLTPPPTESTFVSAFLNLSFSIAFFLSFSS